MISPAIAALPGFAAFAQLGSAGHPGAEALTGKVLQFVNLIAGTGESIQLVNSLPVSEAPSSPRLRRLIKVHPHISCSGIMLCPLKIFR